MLRAVLPRFQWIPSIMTCQFSQAPEGDAGWTMATASSRRWWQISPSTDQRETRSSFQHVGRRCISRTDPLPQSRFKSVDKQTIETRCCNGTANSSRLELRPFEGAKELFLDVGASIATPAPVFSYARHAHHHRVALARLRVRCQGCGSFTPSCSISAGQATGCWTLGTQLALAWPEMAIFRFLLCRNSRPIGHAIRIVTQVVLSS